MRFSLDWLLELCPAERDVERIAAVLTARGLTVDSVEPAGEDRVLDVDIPANRGDCLGHLGVARELAAALGAPPPGLLSPPPATDDAVRVEIDAPDLCGRYTACIVRDVGVGPSPAWVVRRLEACGLRSVSNVVDASNLVMLQLGQPIHFFDLERLETDGKGRPWIRIRRARPGETLRTLDGVERRLDDDMLVIADAGRVVALAGVIGGADTEIGPGTRHVLIEAAHFEPRSIRATARRLGTATDASYRFERGIDPEGPPAAQALAARLLHELAAGHPGSAVADAYPGKAAPQQRTLRTAELRRLLGFEPAPDSVLQALGALSLSPRAEEDGLLTVTIPSWRRDLQREADLVEEVARHLGYDSIPSCTETSVATAGAPAEVTVEERARDALSHFGFHEAIGYAMIGQGEDDRFVPPDSPPALPLENPIAEPLARLRRSVLPGLLRAVDLNLRRGSRDVRLFEVGRAFHAETAGVPPLEPLRLGLAWSGAAEPPHWSRGQRAVDLYDLLGVAEHLLDAVRPGRSWARCAAELAALHPGRSARWTSEDSRTVAWGGALHPDLRRGIDQEVFLLEVALDTLALLPALPQRQRPVPRVPAVTRDLSLLLTREVPYRELIDTLRSVEAPAPARFDALDRYQGPPLGEDQTSLTVRVTLEPLERTLTDAETESYREKLVSRLRDALGLRIRT